MATVTEDQVLRLLLKELTGERAEGQRHLFKPSQMKDIIAAIAERDPNLALRRMRPDWGAIGQDTLPYPEKILKALKYGHGGKGPLGGSLKMGPPQEVTSVLSELPKGVVEGQGLSAMLGEAPPPDMVGPDIVPAPGPKLYPKARVAKGSRGLALVQDKLFGKKVYPEPKRSVDALGEAIEKVQEYNTTELSRAELKGFLEKTLSPGQMRAVATKLLKPKAGVDEARYHAVGRLYEQGKTLGSEVMAGKETVPVMRGRAPRITTAIIDRIRNDIGGFTHQDTKARSGRDVLAGMSEDEANQFIKAEQNRASRAEKPTKAPYIRRELTEQYEDFPKTKTQQAVEDLLGKFDEARGKVTMKPTELGAKADGPTMARWLKDKNEARAAYAAIDAQVGGDMALSNKLVAAIQERYPEITAQQLDTAMPRAMKKVYQGLANNREITSNREWKPWEFRRFSPKGHLLIGDTEVPLAQAIADANARHSDASYLEASGMPYRKPTGERVPRPPFMGEKLEGARQDARAAKRPPLVGPPREGAEINELDRPRLVKNSSSKSTAKAFPLDKQVKKVLDEIEMSRRIKLSAADTDSAHAVALAQAQAQGKPLPTKQGVRAELAEQGDVDLTSDFDTFSEREKQARIDNAVGRKAEKAVERELSPRVPEGVRVASELRAGQGGLPPSSLAQVRKMARLAKGRMPEQFGDVSLKGVERPIAEWSPELRQTVDRIMKLAMRRDAGVTRELGRAAWGIAKGDPEATVGMAAHVQKILKMLVTKL